MTGIVKLKSKGQMTLPANIRQMAGLRTGDFLSVTIAANVITLAPQSIIDKRLAKSMADYKAGRSYGPFENPDKAIAFLDKQIKAIKQKKNSK